MDRLNRLDERIHEWGRPPRPLAACHESVQQDRRGSCAALLEREGILERRPGKPLVVADLPGPPALTPVRRMHLAAETGAGLGAAPLGLLLTPGDGGAQGIETRWHMAPAHEGSRRLWQLERRRARTLPPRRWQVAHPAPGADPVLSPPPEVATG